MNQDESLCRLLQGWQDGGLAEEETADLFRQLEADAGLRRRFAGQIAMLGGLRAAAEPEPRWLALHDLVEPSFANSFEQQTLRELDFRERRQRGVRLVQWLAAAAVLLLLAAGWLRPWQREAAVSARLPHAAGDESELAVMAVVVGGSGDIAFAVGSDLVAGRFAQREGWLTLQTLKGVSITLEAPFDAELITLERVRLHHGTARVKVPEGAEGFKLESATFDIVDLGTEFAARVEADGTGTCRVFEGRADVLLLDSVGEVKTTQRLSGQESVSIRPSLQAIERIEESDADWPDFKLPPRPKLRVADSFSKDVLSLKPAGYWRFEVIEQGVIPNEVPQGPRLQAAYTATLAAEAAGNHSGELIRRQQTEFFQIPNVGGMLEGDFTISLFAQFAWLQNFALVSTMRYDEEVQGHPFILQSYAAFRRSGGLGTALHAVLRHPAAWDGGVEVHGNSDLRPLHWYHVAVTRGDGRITLYLDGEAVASEQVGDMPLDCRNLYLGRLNANRAHNRMEARGLVGYLDELAIFPQALSMKEISRLARGAEEIRE
jgi:hypothetical protein